MGTRLATMDGNADANVEQVDDDGNEKCFGDLVKRTGVAPTPM